MRQTAPSQGQNSGSFWNGTVEGAQYSQHDPSSQGHSQNGFSEPFTTYPASQMTQPSQRNGQSVVNNTPSQWGANLLQSHAESVEMSRFPSQDSTGAHSQRHNSAATNSYDQRSTGMCHSVSQASFNISSASSDITGRSHSPEGSAMYTPLQMDSQGFEHFQFPGDGLTESQSLFHKNPSASNAPPPPVDSFTTGPSFNVYATVGNETFMSLSTGLNGLPVSNDSVVYNSSTVNDSPTIWDQDFLDSQRSSPALRGDSWALPSAHIPSVMASPLEYSPSLEGISPRYVQDFPDLVDLPPYTSPCDRVTRKPVGPRQSKVASDSRKHRLNGTSEASDESFKMVGRSSLDIDNTARDHPLYQNVTAQPDGFYHCPWEGQDGCLHKPEKLKCNYEYASCTSTPNP